MHNISICCVSSPAGGGRCCSSGMSYGFLKEASTCRIEKSTHIGIHDPPDALRQALRPYRAQGCMRTATRPKAIRAVGKVLLINCFQQHRHLALDRFVLERRFADRALSPVLLLTPDPYDRG